MFRSVQSLRYALPVMGAAFASSSLCSTTQSTVHCDPAEDNAHAFSQKEFRPFTVRKVTTLSHNTKALLIDLPSKDHQMVSSLCFVVFF